MYSFTGLAGSGPTIIELFVQRVSNHLMHTYEDVHSTQPSYLPTYLAMYRHGRIRFHAVCRGPLLIDQL